MAPFALLTILCALLLAPLSAAQTTIDLPFFGGITSQPLAGDGYVYYSYTYITLCNTASSCGYSDVVITLSTYEGAISTYTSYKVSAYGSSDAWFPFSSAAGGYHCSLNSSTASCWTGSYGSYSTFWTDVTPIPVTLSSLAINQEPEIVTYSDFETVTVTANGNAGATLVLPMVGTYTTYSEVAQATVLDVKDSVMTLAFDNAESALYPFTEQTLTIGPHTWHIYKADHDYSTTRVIDCSFDPVQFYPVDDLTCSISNGGAGALSPGISKTVVTSVPQVTVTLIEGVEKLLSTSTTSAMPTASAGASATPSAGPTNSSPSPSSTPISNTSAGTLPAKASLLAISAVMVVRCLL